MQQKAKGPGVIERIQSGILRRRIRKLTGWLGSGNGAIPERLIRKVGADTITATALGAYAGGNREKALKAVTVLGDEGIESVRRLCENKSGAERAFAVEMLGLLGSVNDFVVISDLYFDDHNGVVKQRAILAASTLAARFPESPEIGSCQKMVNDARERNGTKVPDALGSRFC
ncbi:MAG: hypothetical protein ABII71_04730 [Candidatus Micrarchaeota archaeon]